MAGLSSTDLSEVALEGLLRIVNGILTTVERLSLQQQFREKLIEVVHAGQEDTSQIDSLKEEYKKFADRYLTLKQPFHWNVDGGDNSNNSQEDIDQYLELVEFCAFVGDLDLLKKWGVDSLRCNGGKYILSENFDYYINAFQFSKQESPLTVQELLDELINIFKKMTRK